MDSKSVPACGTTSSRLPASNSPARKRTKGDRCVKKKAKVACHVKKVKKSCGKKKSQKTRSRSTRRGCRKRRRSSTLGRSVGKKRCKTSSRQKKSCKNSKPRNRTCQKSKPRKTCRKSKVRKSCRKQVSRKSSRKRKSEKSCKKSERRTSICDKGKTKKTKCSPKKKTCSPKKKTCSPKKKTCSPKKKTCSPKKKSSCSPTKKKKASGGLLDSCSLGGETIGEVPKVKSNTSLGKKDPRDSGYKPSESRRTGPGTDPFLAFFKDYLLEKQRDDPTLRAHDLTVEATDAWNNLSAKEQKEYEDSA